MEGNVYQHFRKDEHPFIDIVEDWIQQVDMNYSPYLTDFLDPRKRYILETILKSNSDSLKVAYFGGYEHAEKKRALIFPDYYEPTDADYEISLLEIHYPKKFAELKHRQILGTIMSTGLKREYFGDIVTDGDRWQLFVCKTVENYVINQMTKISNISIKLEEVDLAEVLLPQVEWETEHVTTSSLRIDNLISEVFHISRQKAKNLIESNKVKVNWSENLRPDVLMDEADMVSVRNFGRFYLEALEGKTKKEKFRVVVGVIKNTN